MSEHTMPERNLSLPHGPVADGAVRPRDDEGGLRPPPGLSTPRKIWWWFHFLVLVKLARLRFIAVLVAIGAVIAYWDTLRAWYEKLTRPAPTRAVAASDSEFWCPMHPTVVQDQPGKCPICAMPLSKRKKGDKSEEEPLPAGVVSRVQLTPWRVALAGIRTAEVGYRKLDKEIRAVGFVEFDERRLARITARATGRNRIDKLHVDVTGQTVQKGEPLAELYSPVLVETVQTMLDARQSGNAGMERLSRDRLRLWGIEKDQLDEIVRTGKPITHLTIRSLISGHVLKKYQVEGDYVEEGTPLYDVADLSTVWVVAQVYEDDLPFLGLGLEAVAATQAFPGRDFKGTVTFLDPHLDTSTRTLRVRFDVVNPGHDLRPGMYATVTLKVPVARLEQFRRAHLEEWAHGTAGEALAHGLIAPGTPAVPGLEPLLQAAVRQARLDAGMVLAVPEQSVIDTGRLKLVYREAEPNVYEGVPVELGPRSGGYYPVVRGLEPGDRVATTGSFLIDAETRLTGGVASTYFGASAGPQDDRPSSAATAARPSMVEDEDAKIRAILSKLSSVDRRLAEEQGYCPILQDNRLGSMGRPVKLYLKDQPVLLCCKGCVDKARADPERTLKKVEDLKRRPKDGRPTDAPVRPAETEEEKEIREELSKLAPEDRRLAEEQRFCPIQEKNRLGSMGKPVKLLLNGKPVFLCCDSCEAKARANPDQTLRKVELLKAKHKTESPRK